MKLPTLSFSSLRAFSKNNFHIPPLKIPALLQSKVFDYNQQLPTLQKLMGKAESTLFGTYYRFHHILKQDDRYEQRKKTVPIVDYDAMYEQWRRRQLEGDKNITRPGTTPYYALSSGTTGNSSKYIPISKSLLQSIYRGGYVQIASLLKQHHPLQLFGKQVLFLGGCTSLQKGSGYFAGDMSGIMQKYAPSRVSRLRKPGPTITKLPNRQDRLHEMVIQAPKRNIGTIVGLPSRTVLLLEQIIEYHGLTSIFDIRPNLKIMMYSGMSLCPYETKFKTLFQNKVTIYESYNASEGFFGYCTNKDDKGFSFMCDNQIFYELYPLHSYLHNNTYDPSKTLLLSQAQEHIEYILIVSTCGGARRYIIGDTVQCIDRKQQLFQITGRTKQFISICGEHCSVDNFTQTADQLRDNCSLPGSEFTVYASWRNSKPCHERRIGISHKTSLAPQSLSAHIDKILGKLNDDYAVERMGPLAAPKVHLVDNDLFTKFLVQELGAQAQSKFPRVLNEKQYQKWIVFLKQSTH